MKMDDYKMYFMSDYCDLLCSAFMEDDGAVPIVGLVHYTL